MYFAADFLDTRGASARWISDMANILFFASSRCEPGTSPISSTGFTSRINNLSISLKASEIVRNNGKPAFQGEDVAKMPVYFC